MATGHAKVQQHTRSNPNGGTTTVRQHGRRVSFADRLRNASGNQRLATAGKVAATAAGGFCLGFCTSVLYMGWAAATVLSVACVGIIWCGGQLLTTGHSKRKRRRAPRKRKPSTALKYGKRARLAHYRYRQWRHRRGKGTWSQRAKFGTGARKRRR